MMSETCVTDVAVVQPIESDWSHVEIVDHGLELLGQAARVGARILCLPECFGVAGLHSLSTAEKIQHSDRVLERCRAIAARHDAAIVLPTLEQDGERFFNTSWVVTKESRNAYRKVHLTLNERGAKGLTAGDEFPVFEHGGVRFGVLTCYDLYFPESARILALRGVDVIFVPSHQRAETAEMIAVQVRSRAFDNCVFVARSSYGHARDQVWRPGMPVGASSITDWEGRTLHDLGVRDGFAVAAVPHGGPPPRLRSFEGSPDHPRSYLFEDRRPSTYGALCDVR